MSKIDCHHPCLNCKQVDCLCAGGAGHYKRCSRGCNVFDGTSRLGMAMYGREPKPEEYLGGANAKFLHDAADIIIKLTAERDRLAEWKAGAIGGLTIAQPVNTGSHTLDAYQKHVSMYLEGPSEEYRVGADVIATGYAALTERLSEHIHVTKDESVYMSCRHEMEKS